MKKISIIIAVALTSLGTSFSQETKHEKDSTANYWEKAPQFSRTNQALVYRLLPLPPAPPYKNLPPSYETKGVAVLKNSMIFGSTLISKPSNQISSPPFFPLEYKWNVKIGDDILQSPEIISCIGGVLSIKGSLPQKGEEDIVVSFPDLSRMEGEELSFLKRISPRLMVNVFEGEDFYDPNAKLVARDLCITELSKNTISLDVPIDGNQKFFHYNEEAIFQAVEKSRTYYVVLNLFIKEGVLKNMASEWNIDYYGTQARWPGSPFPQRAQFNN